VDSGAYRATTSAAAAVVAALHPEHYLHHQRRQAPQPYRAPQHSPRWLLTWLFAAAALEAVEGADAHLRQNRQYGQYRMGEWCSAVQTAGFK